MTTKAGKSFTLANLAAVILIVGSEAIVVYPRINDFIKNHRLNNAAREVWQDMHRARLLAIKEKRTIRVEFDHNSYKVVRVATGEIAFKRNLNVDYPDVLISTTDVRGRITFDRTGTADGNTTEIEIQGPTGTRRFTILATGKIKGPS
jgi:Tfp pilus assembly protein FimT